MINALSIEDINSVAPYKVQPVGDNRVIYTFIWVTRLCYSLVKKHREPLSTFGSRRLPIRLIHDAKIREKQGK